RRPFSMEDTNSFLFLTPTKLGSLFTFHTRESPLREGMEERIAHMHTHPNSLHHADSSLIFFSFSSHSKNEKSKFEQKTEKRRRAQEILFKSGKGILTPVSAL